MVMSRGDELVKTKAPKSESDAQYNIGRQMKGLLNDVAGNKQGSAKACSASPTMKKLPVISTASSVLELAIAVQYLPCQPAGFVVLVAAAVAGVGPGKLLQANSVVAWVSRDNFASFTEFPVNENNTLAGNGFSANPADVRINISSVAGGQASVRLRFRYKNEYLGGTYAWMIDDLALSELDPVEVQARLGGVIADGPSPSYTGYSTYSAIPLSLVTPVTPILALTNNGSAGQTNVPVSATIFRGTTQVYNQVATYPSLPAVAVDSLVEWTGAGAAYTPSTIDNYVATFGVNLTGDGYTRNNVDTFRFNVTDSAYTTYASTITGGYFLHRPNTHSAGEANFYFGTRFDIPTGTAVGSRVIAHVYKLNDANPTAMTWDNVASSRELTLTANDISITGTTRFATFPMNIGLGIGSLILGEGTYVTAVTTNAVPAANTVTINATAAKYNAPGIVYYVFNKNKILNRMAKNLLIVESPAKAKTIEKILGSDFEVKSCFGHIRDLEKEDMGIDIKNNFQPKYKISEDKEKVVKDLRSLARKSQEVWLATDEDREDPLNGMVYTQSEVDSYLHKINAAASDYYTAPLTSIAIIYKMLEELALCYRYRREDDKADEIEILMKIISE
ncbi:toprim domain protein [Ostertagia ostertagi]